MQQQVGISVGEVRGPGKAHAGAAN